MKASIVKRVRKGWLFFAANLFLLMMAIGGLHAQSWNDTIDSTHVVKKPKLSIFLHERFFKPPVIVPVHKEIIKGFFRPHLLSIRDFEIKPLAGKPKDWAFIILLFCSGLVVWVQVYYRRRLNQVFRAVLTPRLFNQVARGGEVYDERITVNLFVVFIFMLPLFIYEINQFVFGVPVNKGVPYGYLIFYGELMLLVAVFYALKMLALRIVGVVFKTSEVTSSYILTHFIFNLTEGILLIPFMAIVIFNDSYLVLKISLVLYGIMFLYRLIRGFIIGMSETRFSILYLLVFFLAIEILPLLVIWKIVVKYYLEV